MSTLQSIVRRGTSLTAAIALAVGAVVPAVPVHADALNPLTDRSLTLSSSAPGWEYLDGSGNPTYAPPNSGANGQKTGNYFKFKVSSTAVVKTMSFQYCTTSAGDCLAPGDNGWNSGTRNPDTSTTSDLNIHNDNAGEVSNANFGNIINTSTGDIQTIPGGDISTVNYGTHPGNNYTGNYIVMYNNGGTWTQSTGWDLSVHNVETGTVGAETATGKNNYIVLTNSSGMSLTAGQEVQVLFFASDNDFYITNPGSNEFFVKINTYNDEYDGGNDYLGLSDLAPASEDYIIDGGVTVANVMNHSIRIQTKVLETMQFSVGTVDPNMLASDDGDGVSTPSTLEKALYADTTGLTGETKHGVCDPILGGMSPSDPVNVLRMGRKTAENSLEVANTFATHSFWRLSSNSSAGATVYYSGNTLSNTVGDEIAEIGSTEELPKTGEEQFGLALANGKLGSAADLDLDNDASPDVFSHPVDYTVEATYEQGADDTATTQGVDDSTTTDNSGNSSWHSPRLWPLIPDANYDEGAGTLNGTPTAKFAFVSSSTLIPEPIASENSQVVDCVTGRMRYIANIAATTPAGIYTTAINYIAAPQY